MALKFTKQFGSISDHQKYLVICMHSAQTNQTRKISVKEKEKRKKKITPSNALLTFCYRKHKFQIHIYLHCKQIKICFHSLFFPIIPSFMSEESKRPKFIISEFMSVRIRNSLPWQITAASQHRHLAFPVQLGWEFLISTNLVSKGELKGLQLLPAPACYLLPLFSHGNIDLKIAYKLSSIRPFWIKDIKPFSITNSPQQKNSFVVCVFFSFFLFLVGCSWDLIFTKANLLDRHTLKNWVVKEENRKFQRNGLFHDRLFNVTWKEKYSEFIYTTYRAATKWTYMLPELKEFKSFSSFSGFK